MAKKTRTSTDVAAEQAQVREDIRELLDDESPDPMSFRRLAVREIDLEIELCSLANIKTYKNARELADVRGKSADLLSWTPGQNEETSTDWGDLLGTPQPVAIPKVSKKCTVQHHQGLSPTKIRLIIESLQQGATLAATAKLYGVNIKTVDRYKQRHIRDGVPLPTEDPLA